MSRDSQKNRLNLDLRDVTEIHPCRLSTHHSSQSTIDTLSLDLFLSKSFWKSIIIPLAIRHHVPRESHFVSSSFFFLFLTVIPSNSHFFSLLVPQLDHKITDRLSRLHPDLLFPPSDCFHSPLLSLLPRSLPNPNFPS